VVAAVAAVAALTVPLALAAPAPHDPTAAAPAGAPPTSAATTPSAAAARTEANPDRPLRVEVGPDGVSVSGTLSVAGACDELDARSCLLPFPNDRFTVADPTTDTGRRVHLDLLSMPRDVAGKPVDPTEWNRNDGFSPSTPILTYVPGLALERTWGMRVPVLDDLARSLRDDAPIVLLDVDTGRRVPFWSELDQHAGTTDADRLLILRPAVELPEGHRIVVALRHLRRADGSTIPAGPLFAAYRDHRAAPAGAPDDFEERRPHLEELFRDLRGAGVDRDGLFLAWDFTVASERNLSERVLTARDAAFATLGDHDLADGVVEGRSPGFAITKVTDFPDGASLRRVEGTITVPNFLTPQIEVLPSQAQPVQDGLNALLDAARPVTDALKPVTGVSPVNPTDLLRNVRYPLPGSRFTTDPATGLPAVDPLQPTVDVPFQCEIARTSLQHPSHPLLYGHGLLGSRDEVGGSSTVRLRERGFSPCAVDWWGLSFLDLPNVALTLVDLSGFPSVADRSQQGFVNFLFLGRALRHPQGLTSAAAFRGPKGRPLVDPSDLAYDGNSQGAIMGGALTALSPDLQRGVLGVPGMGYSTLLNRSVDWEGKYGAIYEATYQDAIDQQLGYALLQMLWDRAETSGYAQHLTTDPLPGTPPHEVFLQVAFGDHQVANVAAEVEGRTAGAKLRVPVLAPGRHWSVDPAFGFRTVSGDQADVGSVLVYWYAEGTGLRTPPSANVPQGAGKDPHGAPRQYGPATDQVATWLREGRLVDVCHGGPCTIPAQP
jgi:hypothetical protein